MNQAHESIRQQIETLKTLNAAASAPIDSQRRALEQSVTLMRDLLKDMQEPKPIRLHLKDLTRQFYALDNVFRHFFSCSIQAPSREVQHSLFLLALQAQRLGIKIVQKIAKT